MSTKSPRFDGKTAVITGGGSGIGRAIACRLSAEGARTIILDLGRDQAMETAEALRRSGGEADTVLCNVADAEAVKEAMIALGPIDVLINSAGIAHVGNIEGTTEEDFDRVYSVNVKGTYHCMRSALPMFPRQGGGVILNLASIASKIGIQNRFAYSMSKGSVLAMTLSVARDYVERNIRCNCICPARIHTPFVDGILAKYLGEEKEAMHRKMSEYQPMGRMGTPDEVAALAAFLCSDEASFITGAAYDIDGGVIGLR